MQHVQGICLIELLVSAAISSIILLALLCAQFHDQQTAHQIQSRILALNLVNNSCEIWLADNILNQQQFDKNAQLLLPRAHGAIHYASPEFMFLIQWADPQTSVPLELKFKVVRL